MKVLLSILREMADIPHDADVVANALNQLGMAVEETIVTGTPIAGIVTARILRTEKHPDAAKLTRCFVDAGDGIERHVWCGASNMGAGDIVPLATLGTAMPDGRQISSRGILGIDSEGMLCSASELGLSADAAGLLILPPDTASGLSPFDVLGIEHDVLFDLDLTRNRPECWGHVGVARDIAAHLGVAFYGPRIGEFSVGDSRSPEVSIVAGDQCGMFSLVTISGVVVTNSPDWVVRRLDALGMRSINNVVDASNLVMLELNQPNHAYDAIVVSSFTIRMARSNEKMTTLDGTERTLSTDDLLICNGVSDAPVGLAGIMGDLYSEISTSTTVVNLEAAWFSPDPIRFTSQRHGIRSEASLRFERGVDHEGYEMAAQRFVTILQETCPNVVLHQGVTVQRAASCPIIPTIQVSVDRVAALLGVRIESDVISSLLAPIGFAITISGDALQVVPPTWRPDCAIAEDIVEEIARHYGYDRIGKTYPKSPVYGRLSHVQARRRLLRQVLVGLGLDEAMPSPFVAPGDMATVGLSEDNVLRIANPLVSEESVLRTSLRPGMLRVLQYNLSHRAPRISLFEIGHVYPSGASPLPDESEQLCVVVVGADVSTALMQWNTISEALGIGALLDQSKVPPGMHPTRSATLARGKTVVGVVGEIDPVVLHSLGIDARVSCLEINLSIALAEQPKPVQAKDINRFPSSDIDLAFIVPHAVTGATLMRALRQAVGKRLVSAELFDVYSGQGVPEGARSLAFRIRLQEVGATLTDAAISEVQQACVAAATKAGAALRS
jgi:phenylalanyl-tRNA synthetase beta chain